MDSQSLGPDEEQYKKASLNEEQSKKVDNAMHNLQKRDALKSFEQQQEKQKSERESAANSPGTPPTSNGTVHTKKNPFSNFKAPKIDSKAVTRGLTLAPLAGLKIGEGALDATAKGLDLLRGTLKVGENLSNGGMNVGTQTLNLTDKAASDTQSVLTNAGKGMNDIKTYDKKLKAAGMKVEDIDGKLKELWKEAVQDVGQGADYFDLTPEQGEQVLEAYDSKMRQLFADHGINDISMLDRNSDEAKALGRMENYIGNLRTYANRDDRNEQRLKEADLREQLLAPEKVLSDIRIDELEKDIKDMKAVQALLSNPTVPYERKLLYEVAYEADKKYNSKLETGGFLPTDMGRVPASFRNKILKTAWDRLGTARTEDEKDALTDIIYDVTFAKDSLNDQKTDVANDVYAQKLLSNIDSVSDYLKVRFRHNRDLTTKLNGPDMDIFEILDDRSVINTIQNEFLRVKKKQLEDMNLRNDGSGWYAVDPNTGKKLKGMNKSQVNALNNYLRTDMLLDVAMIRNGVKSNVQNLFDTKRFGKLSADKVVQDLQSGKLSLEKKKMLVYGYILQEHRDDLEALVDASFKNFIKQYDDYSTHNPSRVNSIHKDNYQKYMLPYFENVYDAIAKELNTQFGNYALHEIGGTVDQRAADLTNILLFKGLKKMDKTNAIGNKALGFMGQAHMTPEMSADESRVGRAGAKYMNKGIKEFGGKSIADIGVGAISRYHTRYTQRYAPNSPEYKAAEMRENRMVLSKMLYSIVMSPDSSDEVKAQAKRALTRLSKYDLNKSMRNRDREWLARELDDLQKMSGFGASIDAGMGKGFSRTKQSGILSPVLDSNGKPVPNEEYWKHHIRRYAANAKKMLL